MSGLVLVNDFDYWVVIQWIPFVFEFNKYFHTNGKCAMLGVMNTTSLRFSSSNLQLGLNKKGIVLKVEEVEFIVPKTGGYLVALEALGAQIYSSL